MIEPPTDRLVSEGMAYVSKVVGMIKMIKNPTLWNLPVQLGETQFIRFAYSNPLIPC